MAARNTLTLGAVVVAVSVGAAARTVSVPTMPVSPYADTEVSASVAIDTAQISYADVEFHFCGTPTNSLELAFGTDANTNGVLEAAEIASRFGWRGGRYFIENAASGEVLDGVALDPSRSFTIDLRLEMGYSSRQVRKAAVSGVNAAEFGALATNVPPAWLWRREWDLMRVTRRGTEPPSDWLEHKTGHCGFSLRLR